MIPRECDNDNCDYDEQGRWVHAAGCNPLPPLPEEEARELIRRARPGSFLADVFASALLHGAARSCACGPSAADMCDENAEENQDYCAMHEKRVDEPEALAEAIERLRE